MCSSSCNDDDCYCCYCSRDWYCFYRIVAVVNYRYVRHHYCLAIECTQQQKGSSLQTHVSHEDAHAFDQPSFYSVYYWKHHHHHHHHRNMSPHHHHLHWQHGQMIKSPHPKTTTTSLLMNCPHCARKFNSKAYQRHVDHCKSKLDQKVREERLSTIRTNSLQKSLAAGEPAFKSKIPQLSRSGSQSSFNSNYSAKSLGGSSNKVRDGSTSSRGEV